MWGEGGWGLGIIWLKTAAVVERYEYGSETAASVQSGEFLKHARNYWSARTPLHGVGFMGLLPALGSNPRNPTDQILDNNPLQMSHCHMQHKSLSQDGKTLSVNKIYYSQKVSAWKTSNEFSTFVASRALVIIYEYNKPTRCNSGSTVFINNYRYALHVSDVRCLHHQEHYKL